MAALTIRNIDEELKRKLRIAAAEQGVSMEEHVRQLLQRATDLQPDVVAEPLGQYLVNLYSDAGGVELELPPRNDAARWVDFD